MSLVATQALRFVMVGVSLLALDATLYSAAVLAGLPIALANPISRGLAAIAGYYAHRGLTFASQRRDHRSYGERLRYALLWVGLTVISTQTLVAIAAAGSGATAMVAKPLVEALLALISFLALKLWVYRQ